MSQFFPQIANAAIIRAAHPAMPADAAQLHAPAVSEIGDADTAALLKHIDHNLDVLTKAVVRAVRRSGHCGGGICTSDLPAELTKFAPFNYWDN